MKSQELIQQLETITKDPTRLNKFCTDLFMSYDHNNKDWAGPTVENFCSALEQFAQSQTGGAKSQALTSSVTSIRDTFQSVKDDYYKTTSYVSQVRDWAYPRTLQADDVKLIQSVISVTAEMKNVQGNEDKAKRFVDAHAKSGGSPMGSKAGDIAAQIAARNTNTAQTEK